MTKLNFESISITVSLAIFATASTVVEHMQLLQGKPLSILTACGWAAAIIVCLWSIFLDEVDYPTTLLRYIMAGVTFFALQTNLWLSADVVYATSILLIWRWCDVGLMWLNWHRCRT